jgi:regulator of RNase E activity RraA
MIFSFDYLVSELSHIMTLERGDVILCGTPANARPMEPGDEVVVELVGLSTLRNKVVQDTASASPLMPKPQVSPRVRAVTSGAMAYRPVFLSEKEIAALRSTSVATLIDRLSRNGVDVKPLAGLDHRGGDKHMVGYAYTVRQVPSREDGAGLGLPGMKKRSIAAICSVGTNEVVVAEGAFSPEDAATILEAIGLRNAAGFVTAGATAGSSDHVSIYGGGSAAADLRLVPVATNLPIELSGQLVSPGDIIVGDGTAVIAIPAAAAQLCAQQLGEIV